jgi:histidine decarboxylase
MIKNNITDYTSQEKKYCEGYFSNNPKNNYLLGVNISSGKTKISFSHEGSSKPDEIIAFDNAEISKANLGQTNMMTVSSFCGPRGLIWGYDLCKITKKNISIGVAEYPIPLYDLNEINKAFTKLTGTINRPRFPFLPGSHVPCATKCITKRGEAFLYAALAIGIPVDRTANACLLMEDAGTIPLSQASNLEYKEMVLKNLVDSILVIGRNQYIKYKEILAGIEIIYIDKSEIGCALIAAPYFVLAQNAIMPELNLFDRSIYEWEDIIKNNFEYNHGNNI